MQHKAKMVFIANPNNPTGTFLGAAELLDFMRALPPKILVVLDEAYNEYLPQDKRYDSVSWLKEFPNLIISRTFSKAYGLAGLRVGYAIGARAGGGHDEPRAPAVQRQQRGAGRCGGGVAGRWLSCRQTFELNRRGMEQITAGLDQAGAGIHSVLWQLHPLPHRRARTAMYRRLLELGVIVRPIANYDMPDYLRVSIGLETENEKFLSALNAGT